MGLHSFILGLIGFSLLEPLIVLPPSCYRLSVLDHAHIQFVSLVVDKAIDIAASLCLPSSHPRRSSAGLVPVDVLEDLLLSAVSA